MEEIPCFSTNNLTPAVSVDEIVSSLIELKFSERDIRSLTEHSEFPSIPFRCNQLCFLHEYCKNVLDRHISITNLSFIFDMNERTVRKNIKRGPLEPKPLGRHKALSEDVENIIIDHLIERYFSGNSMTQTELLEYVRQNYDMHLTRGWVHAFIGRHLDKLHLCRSLPQEDSRLLVPRAYLEQHIDNMKMIVQGKFSELVFNLDEVGSSDWEDQKPKKVIVPYSVKDEDVYHSVTRRYKHLTLLACVSAAGDALTPMVITSNAIKNSIWSKGLRPDHDVFLRRREPPYINEELFYEYITQVLLPFVSYKRRNTHYDHQKAVLMMDSCSSHISERILKIMGENNIIVLTFPSHTTNLFQALDLSFFGALKTNKQSSLGDFGEDSINEQITKLIHSYQKTATCFTIRGTFRRVGLEPYETNWPFKLRFVEERVRENPGFKSLWDLDVSVEDLTKRRREIKFGVINEEFLISSENE